MHVSTILVCPFVAMNVPCISELKTTDVQPLKKHIPSDFDRLFVMAISKLSSNKILV